MPEGCEIWHSADILREKCKGKKITEVSYASKFDRMLTGIEEDLPLEILDVVPRGKRISFVNSNENGEGSAIVFFYALTGRLCFKKPKKPVVTFTLLSDEGEETSLYFEDRNMLGFVKYAISVYQVNEIFKSIGPDFLAGEVTLEIFRSVIENKRMKNKCIADLLLDQKRFSGIGNWLRAEILRAAGISPHRTLGSLEKDDIDILYESSMKIMKKGYAKGGMESNNYLDPLGNKGKYQSKVYGREEDPDGNEVVKEKIGPLPKGKDNRRTIHWCPDVQE